MSAEIVLHAIYQALGSLLHAGKPLQGYCHTEGGQVYIYRRALCFSPGLDIASALPGG